MSFAIVAAKTADPVFRARLAVAVTEQCRFMLGQAQGARSSARFAWDLAHARSMLFQLANSPSVDRIARICLLPADWLGFDPDDDAALQGRVAERMTMFASDSPPA